MEIEKSILCNMNQNININQEFNIINNLRVFSEKLYNEDKKKTLNFAEIRLQKDIDEFLKYKKNYENKKINLIDTMSDTTNSNKIYYLDNLNNLDKADYLEYLLFTTIFNIHLSGIVQLINGQFSSCYKKLEHETSLNVILRNTKTCKLYTVSF
jgi:hypothetical protein